MSMTAEKLRQLALQTGATMKIDGKVFNADGLKLAAKKVEPVKAIEPVKPDNTLEIVSIMLTKTIMEVAEKQGLDHAALINAITKLQQPPKPVYTSITPIRNSDGTVKRYELKTQ